MSAFTVDGYRVLLFDCSADSLSITAAASETGETFRIERWQLSRIKPSTVEAAFRRESPHLKYRFAREEKGLLLTITAAMEYLPTIEETIAMDLAEGESLQSVLRELQLQLRGLENQLEEINNREEFFVGIMDGNGDEDQKYTLMVPNGAFLIEASGLLISTTECQDQYDEEAEYCQEINFSGSLLMQILIIVSENGQQKQRHQVPLCFNRTYGYEIPFWFTQCVRLDSPGKISLYFNSNNQYQLRVADSLVKVSSICLAQ